MSRDWVGMIRRGLRKPPRVILRRLHDEVKAELERFLAPARGRRLTGKVLSRQFGLADVDGLWKHLGSLPYLAVCSNVDPEGYERVCPGDRQRILEQADKALSHQVDLLGSGQVCLGEAIDWHQDYKTGIRWEPAYIRSIDYNNPERPSDVKFPWELSRLQWAIPAGQAFLLTGDELYADGTRELLEQWIRENPYAFSVNWACTMEVALRILSWSWLFHVFKDSQAWNDPAFRERFLCSLYLHGDFTSRHLERSDVNGNHYTADAAGLVFAGLFFHGAESAAVWLETGWSILMEELPRQVTPDGVDFEGSVPYHRLVQELFFLPALYRERCGKNTPSAYRERVTAMARFTLAYTQPDGNAPLIGDADDARALPFGGQGINDHRYLLGLIGNHWAASDLIQSFSGPKSEVYWLLGAEVVDRLPGRLLPLPGQSASFPDGGYYILGHNENHVFVDCAPLGLAGRGGHGHNDCLSFEAVLDGIKLISDCGAYLYTASFEERNNFRSTAYHNTPMIDGKEINRFIRPDYLWNLHYDAVPHLVNFHENNKSSVFEGEHYGYLRLSDPVRIMRKIELSKDKSSISIHDEFQSRLKHKYTVPLHFGPGITIRSVSGDSCILTSGEKQFQMLWGDKRNRWDVEISDGDISPSYGLKLKVNTMRWSCTGASTSLDITIMRLCYEA